MKHLASKESTISEKGVASGLWEVTRKTKRFSLHPQMRGRGTRQRSQASYLLLGSTSAFLQMRLEKRRPTPLMEVSEYCT